MLTNLWRSLRRLTTARESLPSEFRADAMDASWRPVYLDLRGNEPPKLVQIPYSMF